MLTTMQWSMIAFAQRLNLTESIRKLHTTRVGRNNILFDVVFPFQIKMYLKRL